MRSGFVLLTVLALLVLVLAAMTGVIARGAEAKRAAASHAQEQHLMDGLKAGETLALAWLRVHAATAVVTPEAEGVTVARDFCQVGSGSLEVQVDAYDALGQIPWSGLAGGGRLRQVLPVPVVRALAPAVATGDQDWSLVQSAGVRVFPMPLKALANHYGGMVHSETAPLILARGALATLASPMGDGRINVNTASAKVMEAAFTELGIDGVETLLEQRRRGSRVTAPVAKAASTAGVSLVESSDRWAFLIHTAWNGRSRSWWVIAVGNGEIARIVRRHDADR